VSRGSGLGDLSGAIAPERSPKRGYDLALRSRRVVVAGSERPATVCVHGGVIEDVFGYDAPIEAGFVVELGDDALLPGLVDTHVHVNEPGRTEWEGFASATRAAAAGGVTTIVDMPLNAVPPTVDPAALKLKREAAAGQCAVDVGFWGGAIPGNIDELARLHDDGVFGFKCFLVDSGVPEFPPLGAEDLGAVARASAALGAVLLVHAEDPAFLAPAGPGYGGFLASRPQRAEDAAITRLVALSEATGARIHVLHLSSASGLATVAAAKAAGVAITAETCPHYLVLTAEEVPDGATEFKCCPPIRDAANREELWRALAGGTLDCVVSDHSPCPPGMKAGDFDVAWGGIASLQLGLPLVWTEARQRGHRLPDVVRWMAEAPADLAGLARKGRIAPGYDADFTVFTPDSEFVVEPSRLEHRHPVTPYAGRRLTGEVRGTWLAGRRVNGSAAGRLLVRESS
jgi:allantoinase